MLQTISKISRRRTWLSLCKGSTIIGQNEAENLAKPIKKSSHTDRYDHEHRPLWTRAPTVMNMDNGRCETTFSMLSPDKKIGFKHFSPYFQEMITWGRNNRGNNRGNHKSHKGATKTILFTPITMEKKLFLLFPCCSLVVPLLFNIVEFFIYNFFIDNEMRLRLRSTSTTRTFTCWCNFTTWVGSAT